MTLSTTSEWVPSSSQKIGKAPQITVVDESNVLPTLRQLRNKMIPLVDTFFASILNHYWDGSTEVGSNIQAPQIQKNPDNNATAVPIHLHANNPQWVQLMEQIGAMVGASHIKVRNFENSYMKVLIWVINRTIKNCTSRGWYMTPATWLDRDKNGIYDLYLATNYHPKFQTMPAMNLIWRSLWGVQKKIEDLL
jgi:hypothetical protein